MGSFPFRIQDTFRAYLCEEEICSVDATSDFFASNIKTIPDQSDDSSVDLHTGQTLPVVNALHFLQATSLANCGQAAPFFSFA